MSITNRHNVNKINNGFTMIELLIVLAIMSTLMGLVGPLAINAYDKAQAKTEKYQLNNFINKLSYEAFTQGQTKRIDLEGNQVSIYAGEEEIPAKVFNFKYLFFQPQYINLNSNGFTLSDTIDLQIRGQSEIMTLDLSAGKKHAS